jgi:hypothetical protein
MKKLLRLLLLATAALVGGASSATAQLFELQCPTGFHPFPSHTTVDNSTGQYRNWLCYDDNGNVNIAGASTTGACTVAPVLGSTTAGIQETINTCASSREVFIPCGTYVPTTGININTPIALIGAQQSCVIIKPAPNPAFHVITITSSNVSVQSLTVDGDATGETNFSAIKLTDGASSISNINFDKVTAQNAGDYCIGWNQTSGAPSNVTITNSTLSGCAKREFYGNWASSTTAGSGYFFSNSTFGSTTAPANNPSPTGFMGAINFTVSAAATVSNINILNNSIFFPVLNSPSQESDGIVISTGGTTGAVITGITVSGNNLAGPSATTPVNGHAFELWGASQATVLGNFSDRRLINF